MYRRLSTPISVLLLAQTLAAAPQHPFVESELPGLRTTSGAEPRETILEVNGGGLALGDFDGDGETDLVIVDGSTIERVEAGEPGLPPRLLLGDGEAGFRPAGEPWAMTGGRWGMGAAAGDVNGDGRLDLVLTEWGRDRLLLNRSEGGFAERDETSGFVGERWGTSGAFGDFDLDGDLDLAVVNYLAFDLAEVPRRSDGACNWKGHSVLCGPEGMTPVHDQYYTNLGDGRFEDASRLNGFRPDRAGFGLGAMTLDYDLDGDTDLYVTNDSTPNHLWENGRDDDGALAWTEVGLRRGIALDANGKEQAGMGIACGDLDGDGTPDLFVTNFSGESNALYLSGGRGRYRERSGPSRLGGPSVRLLGWGTCMEDFDLDGDLDLCVFNGHVYAQADRPGTDTSFAQPDFFHRQEAGRFEAERITARAPSVSRAAAAADLNGDGRAEIVALDLGGAVRVLRPAPADERAAENRWLGVRLAGRGANTMGVGARIVAHLGERELTRELRTAGGFQSAVPPEVVFGLGPANELERLTVHWPSGVTSVLEDVAADRWLTVSEPGPSDRADGGEDDR